MSEKSGSPLYREVLTPDVEKKLVNRKSPCGATLHHIIRSGRENPDSSIGCYAADEESYGIFAPLFDPVIEKYHGHPRGNVHGGRLAQVADQGEGALDDPGMILSTRIRVGRNLCGYPFPSMISRALRLEVEEKIVRVLQDLSGEPAGVYLSLSGMDEGKREKLVEEHLLFKKGDRFLESAGINRHWPDGRGIFLSHDRRFLVWVNEEDHLRIIAMERGGDIKGVFQRLITSALILEEKLKFAFTDRLGYLASCPTNLGTSMRASVHIRLPNLGKTGELSEICRGLGLSVRGTDGEHSEVREGIYDISNRRRLGISEKEIIRGLCSGLRKLISMEKKG